MVEQTASDADSLLLTVGVIQGAFGVRGLVRVRSFMSDPTSLADYHTWWIKAPEETGGCWHKRRIRHAQWHSNAVLASIEGLEDRDEAARLSGCAVALERSVLPPLADGEFYWADLLGMTVINLQGQALGTVLRVIATGANDCLEVRAAGADTVTMIPFLWQTVVHAVDQTAKRLVVDWDAEEPENQAP